MDSNYDCGGKPGQPHWTEEPKPGVSASNLFRKKPIVIEAFCLDGGAMPEWFLDARTADVVQTFSQGTGNPFDDPLTFAYIHTLEGVMRADRGDWIIHGLKGEMYPCKPDIFAMTYEVARAAVDTVEALKPLTSKQIEEGWKDTFNTNDPFCPCDLKSFSKAVNWVERQRTITLARTKALGSKATEGQS